MSFSRLSAGNPVTSVWRGGGKPAQPHSIPACRLFPSFVQVRPVFIPPSCATLLLYRWSSITILSWQMQTVHEQEAREGMPEASLKRMELAEECIGLQEWARQVNRL